MNVPDSNFLPWSIPGCMFEVAHRKACGQPGVTVDGHNGRRCADHPPTFSAATAVRLAVEHGPDTAAAYCRGEWGEG